MLYIFLLIFLGGCICDFKRTVLLFAPFKIMIFPAINIMPNLGLSDTMSFFTILFFFFRYGKQFKEEMRNFPIPISFILMILSSAIVLMRDGIHIKALITLIFLPLDIIILFILIKNKRDIELLIKSLIVFCILILFNGIFEIIINQNFLSDCLLEYVDEGFFVSNDNYSRGVRMRSFMPHSIGFGNVCSIFLYFFIFLLLMEHASKKISLFISIGLFAGIILSLSRTPLLGLIVFAIPFLTRIGISKNHIIFLLFLLLSIYLTGDYFKYMLGSLVSDDSEVGGSSMDLRVQQLLGCFMVIKDNLIFGLGLNFHLDEWDWILAGNESVWFKLLCFQGLFGCFCYGWIFYEVIKKSRKNQNSIFITYLSIGYLVEQTATYNAGINDYIFFLFFVIFYRYGEIKDRLFKSQDNKQYLYDNKSKNNSILPSPVPSNS